MISKTVPMPKTSASSFGLMAQGVPHQSYPTVCACGAQSANPRRKSLFVPVMQPASVAQSTAALRSPTVDEYYARAEWEVALRAAAMKGNGLL